MAEGIRLVAGLGNIGHEYVRTRHNAGFWFADVLAEELGATFANEARFFGDVARAGSVRIVKPTTYMNLSGRAVGALARFYGIEPAQILVVHDELDLHPGDAKLKLGGGVAGHNGLKDIRAQLGTPDFWRLRLGIAHPRDTATPARAVVDYVLGVPTVDEQRAIDDAIGRGLAVWPSLARGEFERAMLELHSQRKDRS
ncbi:MAG: aminoacyl-tRNA hydrolase [Proteobacteria bacterium]|nr:aminoacyl-tRNA hydrolase [Pseudomonadota bacterium]